MHSSLKHQKTFRTRLRKRAQFLALLLGAVSAENSLMAQSYWVPTTSALWQVATNWSTNATGGGTGLIPSATSAAIFSIVGNTGPAGTLSNSVWLNGNRAALGITLQAGNGNINIQANQTGTTVRSLTLGAGGLTVNVGAGALTNTATTTSGLTNTLLLESQSWTNNGASAITWNSRLVGHESTTLTKAGTSNLVLSGDNSGVTAVVNGATVTGLRGKVVVAAGTLALGNNNALGIRDAQTTATNSTGLLAGLVSDTQVLNGATLNLNAQSTTNEFVSFQGAGNGGIGAIVNNSGATNATASSLSQALMTGDATVGGTGGRFAFGQPTVATPGVSRFFQDSFTLTKTGSGVVAFVNNQIIGGGNINIQQGTLSIEGSTNLEDAFGSTPSAGTGAIILNGGQLNFNSISGSISRPIVHNGGSIAHNSNDTVGTVLSPIVSNAANLTINVSDDNSIANQRGTLTLSGALTSAGTITKGNSGVLNMPLDDSNFTGSAINVTGGQFNLLTFGNAIAANINLAVGSTGANIQRPTIGGEGETSGTLTFAGLGNSTQANIVVFNGATTGPTDHLRVGGVSALGGANSVEARLSGPAASGANIVILETTVNPHALTNQIFFNGRGTIDTATNPNQVLLNYAGAGNLVWRGNDANPTFFNLKTSTNWDNAGNPDLFYDGDNVMFDDTVLAGSTTVAPQGAVVPSNITFNNGTATYVIDHVGAGNLIAAGTSTLVKNGTGTTTIRNAVGSTGSAFGATTINAGVLEIAYNNPGLASSAGAVAPTLGVNGSGVTINSGGTLRSTANIANSGFGANPVTINAGGILDLTRGSVPNGTTTTPAGITLANNFSGGGDIVLRGVNDTVGTSPNSFFQNAYGNYTVNGNSQGFSGRFDLNNARLSTDNVNGPNTIDELGTATIEVASGGQVVLGGGTANVANLVNGASGYFDNNTFRIAGTGWAFENAPNTQQGAIRFGANNARIASNSSIVLTGNAQIANLNLTNFIDANISETAGPGKVLTIGTVATANNNATLSMNGNNTYSGGTNIENTNVLVNSSSAFGTGAVNLNGFTSARNTHISVGGGITVGNAINLSSFAGIGGSRGAIEGGTSAQVELNGAGVGTVSGPININAAGNLVNNWAHFSAGQGAGSALNVTGPVTVASPGNTAVQARSQNSGGYVQFSGGGNYTAFDVALGTVRLGANNGLASGTELRTRRIADGAATGGGTARGVFDMNGFNQTVSAVTRTGTLTTANFSLVNTSANTSILTITGAADSNIQDIPGAPTSAGAINIVKNGTGALVLSGAAGTLGNAGNYQINGGTFSASAAGQTIGGSVTVNGGGTYNVAGSAGTQTVAGGVTLSGGVLNVAGGAILGSTVDVSAGGTVTGTGTVSGNVTSAGGFNFAPGSSPGALTYGSNVTLSGSGGFQWEINDANGTAGNLAAGYDVINVGGNLDLSGLVNMNIDIVGLTAGNILGTVPNFNPASTYAWTLFDVAGTTSGFQASDFTPAYLTNFEPNNPTIPSSGVFSVSQVGQDIVLNYVGVPEPSSILLIVTGLGISLMSRRRKKSTIS
jgi:fibronectin-binding autotransporter adhesin